MSAQSREWEGVSTVIDALGGNSREVRRRAILDLVSVEVVAEGVTRFLLHATDVPDSDDEPFGLWYFGPPGKMDLRVFDQGVWWVDVLRRPHCLAEMRTDYLQNVQAFLLCGSRSFFDTYHQRSETPAPSVAPVEWVESTELMRAIRTELTSRDQGGEAI